ncbi:MAG: hypothetical protein QHJ73_16965, partial [Armatimonadota bacterium]|nr:hypothetical protein [Armatimonadota bacterium]
NALSLRGNAELGDFTFGLNYRDVGERFSAIESVGFQQRERALDGQLEFRATDSLRFTCRLGSTVRPNTGYYWGYTGTGASTSSASQAEKRLVRGFTGNFGVSMNYPKLPQMDLTHQWYRTKGPDTNNGAGITDLRLNYKVGSAVNLAANFNRNANRDRTATGAGATSFTQRYTASYTPGSRFVLQADYSNSSLSSRFKPTSTTTDTTAGSAPALTVSSNRATTANLTMTWSPITIATLTASMRISDSGAGGMGAYYGGGFGSSGYSFYTGGYVNSGNYGFGDSYTGSYYTPGSTSGSVYGYPSGSSYGYGSGTGGYSSDTAGGFFSTIPGSTNLRGRQNTATDAGSDAASGDAASATGGADSTDSTASTTTNPDTAANTSTRIRSINRSIGLQVNPIQQLSLMLNLTSDLQEGQYTSGNSTSTSTSFGFTWSPLPERLSFNGQVSRQNYRFLGAGGNSGSTIAFGGVQLGFFRPLNITLNYHAMTTNTGLPSLSGLGYGATSSLGDTTGAISTTPGYATGLGATPTAGVDTAYATRMNTLSARLDYPIADRRKVFTTLEHSRVRGGGTYGTQGSPEN